MTTYDSTTVYDEASLTYDGNPAGLANLPVVGVFIAFDDGPYVADPDWVEVTDYVREVAIRRGRQDDLQQFPAGSASVVLDNRDRLFDPFNTAGTYYNKLKPRRQIKIVGQWAGVNYPLFRGFVAGWPVEYSEGGKDSTVTVDCFDALGLLATEKNTTEWITQYTLSLSPSNYAKMDEGQNVTTFTNLTGIYPIVTVLNVYAATKLVPAVTAQSVFSPQFNTTDLRPSRTVSAVSFSAWADSSNQSEYSIIYDRFAPNLRLRAQPTTVLVDARYGGNRYSATVTVSDTTYRYGEPTHFVLTFNPTGNTFTCYINGTAATVGAVTTTAGLYTATYEMSSSNCAIQEWSTYDRILTASEASDLYKYGTAQVFETTNTRLNRIMGVTQFPASRYNLTTSTVQVTDLFGGNEPTSDVESVIRSESGEWFADASGVLQFVDRYGWANRTRSNTSQATFADMGTAVYYDAGSVRIDINADQVRNDVQVQFTNGGLVDAVDSSSVTEFGSASEQIQTLLPTALTAQTLADYRVDIYSQPKIRVEPFLVKGQRNPSYDWPRILALELLDRFTFVRTPSVGSAISKPMLLQSIEHRFTPGAWETIINGSARYTGWFVLDSSLLDGEDVLL